MKTFWKIVIALAFTCMCALISWGAYAFWEWVSFFYGICVVLSLGTAKSRDFLKQPKWKPIRPRLELVKPSPISNQKIEIDWAETGGRYNGVVETRAQKNG